MSVAPEMNTYLDAFLTEARQELARIGSCLESLAREEAALDKIEGAISAMANLKGAAATMGFQSVRDLAHAALDMLDAWRRNTVRDRPASLKLLGDAQGRLEGFIRQIGEGRGSEPAVDVDDLTVRMRALVIKDVADPWPEAAPMAARGAIEQRYIVSLILSDPAADLESKYLVCQGYLLEIGKIIDSDLPPSIGESNGQAVVRFLIETTFSPDQVRQMVSSIPNVYRAEVAVAGMSEGLPHNMESISVRKRSVFHGLSLPVDAGHLEDLAEIANELHLIRAAYRAVEHEAKAAHSLSLRLARLGERLEYSLHQLSDLTGVIRRMPAEHLMVRLVRSAFQKAKDVGKDIDMKLVGADTMIGFEQAEVLLLPLRHLIEVLIEESGQTPMERTAVGKPKTNRLELAAQRGDGKIIFSLSDDGRGMNIKGALRSDGCLASVQKELEAFGGVLDGQSWPGQGTLLTVEVTPPGNRFNVIAVGVGEELYALPMQLVLEARRAADECQVRVDGHTYVVLDGEMLPELDLASFLGRPGRDGDGFWLFTRAGGRDFVLRVPIVLGPRLVMARGGTALPGVSHINGTCTDSNGQMYYLLSPEQLAAQLNPSPIGGLVQ